MPRRPIARAVSTAAAVLTLAACGATDQEVPSVTAPSSITVTSSAFQDGRPIPAQFTCDGAGAVPPLSWSGTPTDAAALAVVVDDPDAPSGTFTHWIVLDLPSATTGIDGGAVPSGAVQAKNSGSRTGWFPPCPPSGTHRYRFTVYALSRRLGLPNGVALGEALRAVQAATVAQGRLVGTYSR